MALFSFVMLHFIEFPHRCYDINILSAAQGELYGYRLPARNRLFWTNKHEVVPSGLKGKVLSCFDRHRLLFHHACLIIVNNSFMHFYPVKIRAGNGWRGRMSGLKPESILSTAM